MARIRTIKPEFWEDEKLAELGLECRLLFIGSWSFADDFGMLLDSEKWIKAKVFPYDTISEKTIRSWIEKLVEKGMFVRFKYGDKSILCIRRFKDHQVIDKRYQRSILPDGEAEKLTITAWSHSEHVVNTPPEMEMEMEMEMDMERKGSNGDKSPKTKKSKSISFEFSELAKNPDVLKMAIMGKPYQSADIDFYVKSAELYSKSKGAKYIDWTAAVENWIKRDYKDKKLKTTHEINQRNTGQPKFAGRTKADFGQL
jgi:hypothetical protein